MRTDIPWFWPALLILAAAVSLAFVVRRIVRNEIGGVAAAGAVLFRVGLILVGVVYAAALPFRAPAALYAALGVAALGAVLNLVGAFTTVRSARRRTDTPTDRSDGEAP